MNKKPVLRFSHKAWAKLQYMRDNSKTEISGYGITSIEDPLYVKDFCLIKQESTSVSTEPTEDGIADYFDEMITAGYSPCEFQRVWIHTHPGLLSPTPSSTDVKTFNELFSTKGREADWGIMFILAGSDKYTCHLKYNVGPVGEFEIPVEVSYEEFVDEWERELKEKVSEKVYKMPEATLKTTEVADFVKNYTKSIDTPKTIEMTNFDEWCESNDCEECEYYNYCYGFSDKIDARDIEFIEFEEENERKI